MATSYLTLVNSVMTRLREQTVTTVSQSDYSLLIGSLINDAKREVEDAWNWEALRTTKTVTTAAGTYNYAVTGAGDRARLLQIYDSTNRAYLEQRNKGFFTQNIQFIANPTQGVPAYYQFNGLSAGGDIKIDVYPVPNGIFTISLVMAVPEAALSADTDSTALPSRPIELLAWAKAIEERGEDGGININSQYAVAKQALLDSISLEAARHPDETIWYSV